MKEIYFFPPFLQYLLPTIHCVKQHEFFKCPFIISCLGFKSSDQSRKFSTHSSSTYSYMYLYGTETPKKTLFLFAHQPLHFITFLYVVPLWWSPRHLVHKLDPNRPQRTPTVPKSVQKWNWSHMLRFSGASNLHWFPKVKLCLKKKNLLQLGPMLNHNCQPQAFTVMKRRIKRFFV